VRCASLFRAIDIAIDGSVQRFGSLQAVTGTHLVGAITPYGLRHSIFALMMEAFDYEDENLPALSNWALVGMTFFPAGSQFGLSDYLLDGSQYALFT